MATSPNRVRTGLSIVTGAAVADARIVAESGGSAAEVRAALFEATPLIVSDYADGAAALALEWYDELREDAALRRPYAPEPLRLVTDDEVRAEVAVSTVALRTASPEDLPVAITTSLRLLEGGLSKMVASGFWDTMTVNATRDPSALGWRRYARAGACKFCVMLAGRGAVFKESTVRFAAHGSCHCLAGPEFDQSAPLASAMQYTASEPTRTPEQRAALRSYLNENFPDAPG